MAGKSRKELLEEMLKEMPDDPETRYALAMEHAGAHDDEGAVRGFRELFTIAPDYAPAYQQAGMALLRLNRPDEARDVLTRGIVAARKGGNSHAAEEMQGLLDTISV